MYRTYWGLKRLPFENVADPYFFYLSEFHKEALSRLFYASKMRKGGAMLTGDIGCGKTLLSKVYTNKLIQEGHEIILLANPPLGPIEFLQEIVYQMGVKELPDSKTKLLQILNKMMNQNMEHNKETIIILDEAQSLSEETFEEAGLLLNFQAEDRFLLTLVLIGRTELKVKIGQIKQFYQRIGIRYHLNGFHLLDTAKYIMFREKKAGYKKNIFTTKAIKKIYEYTSGIPRQINTVCDMGLLVAFNKERKIIDSGIIRSVIDDVG